MRVSAASDVSATVDAKLLYLFFEVIGLPEDIGLKREIVPDKPGCLAVIGLFPLLFTMLLFSMFLLFYSKILLFILFFWAFQKLWVVPLVSEIWSFYLLSKASKGLLLLWLTMPERVLEASFIFLWSLESYHYWT